MPVGSARDQGGGGAVGEQQEAQHLRHVLEILLQMQAAEFQVDHQDAGPRIGADDLVGEFQGVDGGEAAHEADDGALGAVGQAGRAHDLEIQAGRGETGATGDDQVGDCCRIGVQPRTARMARSRACGSYSAMRAAVEGKSPRR